MLPSIAACPYTRAVPTIQFNGASMRIAEGATVATLVADHAEEGAQVAVERNLEIVPRGAWGATPLAEGDRVELVQFVGGG